MRRHSAARSRATIVSPPPGVSSTSISPPIASTKPFATARPSPTPSPWPGVAEPLERLEQPLALGRRDAGAAVDDADVDDAVDDARGHPRAACPAARSGPRSAITLASARSSRPAVGEHARKRLGHVELDDAVGDAEAVQRRGQHLLEADRARS